MSGVWDIDALLDLWAASSHNKRENKKAVAQLRWNVAEVTTAFCITPFLRLGC